MKKEKIINTRNIGIIAHIDAGKTTVTERILYYTGKSYKLGEVHDGEAVMDWMFDEQERGITITSAVTSCMWRNNNLQIIDTPGHVDFTIEVERSLRVLDGAIGIFCAVGGVEPQSETVWHQADKHNVPKIAFINKLDRIGSNFLNTIKMITERLNVQPLIIEIPVGQENSFLGVIDLINMKQIMWDKDSFGTNYTVKEIDSKIISKAKKHREVLIETLAEYDDAIMEAYVTNTKIEKKMLLKTIRKATIDLNIVPVLCGSALKNKGIQPLLDAIINFLPSPLDIVPAAIGIDPNTGIEKKCVPEKSAPLAALIFKVSIIEGRKLYFIRIYSGKITSGSTIFNSTQNKKEKISKILILHANRKSHINSAGPGNIVGIMGLKHSVTGDTLCDQTNKLLLEKINPQKPVISIAIEPKTHSDQEKLTEVLENFLTEDPTITVKEDPDTGQIILSGMGELHLEIIISRMQREFNTNVNIGKPQVVYRETINETSEFSAIFDKEITGHPHYAKVTLKLDPQSRGKGNYIDLSILSQTFPKELSDSIKKGISESLENGIIMGYPVVDVKATVTTASIPDYRGKPLAYKIAASMACRQALKAAKQYLLVPIMIIEISTPETFLGEVIGDLNTRNGKIKSLENRKTTTIIKGTIPLANTFGYSTTLRSITQGRGTFIIHFSKFDVNNNFNN